jgi:glycosyltransferase involved in cell wall biosynthesis
MVTDEKKSRMVRAVKLSILMPVYNEAETVQSAIKGLLDVSFPCPIELVVVDDASTDGTSEIIDALQDERLIKLRHPVNRGKGAAVRTAAAAATGEYVQPFDADLEYRPEDIPELLKPVLRGEAEVVFGSRTFGSHSAYSYWYVMGNKGVTTAANILFNAYIADLETCFKLMPLELYRSLNVTSDGFGMEAEITGKLLARRIRPFEVPIAYRARSREAGKKITWRDGVEAVWILARIRLSSWRAQPPGAGRQSARLRGQ